MILLGFPTSCKRIKVELSITESNPGHNTHNGKTKYSENSRGQEQQNANHLRCAACFASNSNFEHKQPTALCEFCLFVSKEMWIRIRTVSLCGIRAARGRKDRIRLRLRGAARPIGARGGAARRAARVVGRLSGGAAVRVSVAASL